MDYENRPPHDSKTYQFPRPHDTFRKLSKGQRLDLMELTLWLKVLDIIRRIMNALAELIGISAEELVDNIIKDEKSLKKYYVMIEALEQLDKAA